MKLPLHIAKKIQQLLLPGTTMPGSSMQHAVITKMMEDGILQKRQTGKTKTVFFIANIEDLPVYLHNQFGINDLQRYIEKKTEAEEELTRGNLITMSGNSKLQYVRTFYGFLVNAYDPVPAMFQDQPFIIQPAEGSYTFIHDFEKFVPDPSITIVGIENPENFRFIQQQKYLFSNIKPLFVSRYPQSSDLVKWLQMIPSPYLHFGDLDFEGINIYLQEYKKYLGDKASFFLPPGTEPLLNQYGNRELYNRQYRKQPVITPNTEPPILALINLLFQYKKVLEQEIFILKSSKLNFVFL